MAQFDGKIPEMDKVPGTAQLRSECTINQEFCNIMEKSHIIINIFI